MLDAMVQDLERATGPWHAEWIAIPESFILAAGALNQAKFMLGGLVVDEKAMSQKPRPDQGPDRRGGRDDGPRAAHRAAGRARRRLRRLPVVNEKGGRLADVLNAMPNVSSRLDPKLIERLTDPANYLGMAPQMVDQVLASSARRG